MIEKLQSIDPIKVFSTISFFVGLVIFLFNLRSIILANSSKNWKKTRGKVLLSELNVIKNTGETDRSFSPKVKYQYKVNNREYISTRIYFGNKIASSFKKRKSLRIIDNYPNDKVIEVFYNPMNENLSVLEPGVKSEPVSLLIVGIIFTVLGYVFFINPGFFMNL